MKKVVLIAGLSLATAVGSASALSITVNTAVTPISLKITPVGNLAVSCYERDGLTAKNITINDFTPDSITLPLQCQKQSQYSIWVMKGTFISKFQYNAPISGSNDSACTVIWSGTFIKSIAGISCQ